ncbi:MAG: P27 family phage terminase small subunit [Pseudonocardiaceae bacterium]
MLDACGGVRHCRCRRGPNGPVVEGRSDKDRGRMVKNPATVAMREAATQLRYWCRELALTPDARGRTGIKDADPNREDGDNPFAG